MTFNFDALEDNGPKPQATRLPRARGTSEEATPLRRALLVGQPNVGKSVVFGALTGTYVTVSNYPGTTVEITRGRGQFGAERWEIVDTPGTHNLVPMSEDEAVTRDLLISESHDALVQVGDAKNLTRTLLLTLQIAELGVPFCLDLNMLDEARARGLTIDLESLERELPGVRVHASTATQGEGLDQIRDYLARAAPKHAVVRGERRDPLGCAPAFPDDVEAAIRAVIAEIPEGMPVARRAIATMLLAGGRGVAGALVDAVPTEARRLADSLAAALGRANGVPSFALLSRLRLGRARAIVGKVQRREAITAPSRHLGAVSWPRALATALPLAFLGATTYDAALARTSGVSAVDPLAAYGFFAVVARLLSRAIATGWTAPGVFFLAATTGLGTVLVRRNGHASAAAWKIVAAFTTGWLVYFVTSAVEGWIRHRYSAIPCHLGAIAALGALGVGVRAGDARDAALSSGIGRLATHRIWGLAVLGVVLLLAYKIVGEFGAGTAVDFVENRVFGGVTAQASLDGRAAATTAAAPEDGDERITVTSDGPSRVLLAAERARDGKFQPDPDARLDVYARGATIHRTGAGTAAVDGSSGGAEARVWTGYLNRWAFGLFAWLGIPLLTAFFVGQYGLITMGVTYAVAIVLPVVTTFFFVFSMLEDSGYLPRLAVMANRLLRSMGLNGRAVLPMVLGLGCDTMATLTARIMETRKERTLVTLLLALGIPCSSQLSVIFALMQRTSRAATFVWLAVVIGTLLGVGWVAARVLPGDQSDFLLEMPPIRRPQVSNLVAKTMARIEWYLKEAVPLFLAGTALLFVLDAAHLIGYVHRLGEPIVHRVLGFSRDGGVANRVSEALLVGFLRRDFGAAGLLELAHAGRLSPADIAVSMVTITLFIPCIANVFMIAKERGWKAAAAMSGFIFPYAIAVGAVVRLGFRVLGG